MQDSRPDPKNELISGYSAGEVIGKSCSHEAEVYLHHKDGHRIPVSVRVSTLSDAEGNLIGGIELFSDISNQERQTV